MNEYRFGYPEVKCYLGIVFYLIELIIYMCFRSMYRSW